MTDIAELIKDTRERARLRGNHRGTGEPDWVLTQLADALEALDRDLAQQRRNRIKERLGLVSRIEDYRAQIAKLDQENQALAQTANAEISGFTTEWGIAYDESSASTVQIPTHDEAEARSEVADSPTDTGLIKRSVGPWVQVNT